METKRITKADLNDRNEYSASADLVFEGHIEIDGNLGRVRILGGIKVKGRLGISAGSGISAGEGISAGWGISAGEGISAGSGISAGLAVRCKAILKVKLRIFAGVYMWRKPEPEEMEIECAALESGEVAYGNLKLLPAPAQAGEEGGAQ